MSETKSERPSLTAAELRQHMSELEMERIEKQERKRRAAEQAMSDFVEQFTKNHLSDAEVAQMLTKARQAAERGLTEVMVMRFPSSLCEDHGRAINNNETDWPETLPGKARDLYELWKTEGRDKGFRMTAMIVDFPDGKPGDVGLFINWAP
ncbi:MAG: hypothetical protein QNJ30_15325 [Kiloniellales bacterium]|nr:hypothetical protein [Kiloniellales bacterium]